MRTPKPWFHAIGLALSIALAPQAVFAFGANHPKQEVSSSAWPKGMSELVNSPERVHGYFVNAEDVFFFVGDQNQFNKSVLDYARIDGVVKHKIVVHDGVGRARSPWQKSEGVACDWMIYGCPASWKQADANANGYILEIHVWRGGRIKLEDGKLPEGILVETARNTDPGGGGNR